MTFEILLLRHGETEWNAQGRYQGALDSPLTAKGRAQAAHLATLLRAYLGPEPGALTYVCSPLGRTVATAAIVSVVAGLPAALPDARLQEVSLGSWDGMPGTGMNIEGQTQAEPHERYFRSPDGETYEAVVERASSWLADAQGKMGGRVVVVTHGLFSRILRGCYAGLDRNAALALPVPQDVIWRLADGRIEAIR